MLHSALYVARSNLRIDDPLGEVRRFGDAARDWNSRMGVGGVLIVTNEHFGHLLEGPPHAIDRILQVVPHDGFHRDVRILRREQVSDRRFGCWQIGYQGGASYVEKQLAALVQPVLKTLDESIAVDKLSALLVRLGATCSPQDVALFEEGLSDQQA